ncbi:MULTISPECIES: LysR family transcriptional regulator [unclassified Xanthobacter]|uniref:LysR family transcriptional regulator n=1 Tax=unclassified Xanthobacter TaxID=2623496 RepID=UPI001EE04104|nr:MULTISPECIES: LysR family transcriptional regulator [unclassified Xanthobacter]
MDWDKLKVFHVAAEAGSFTHAGETLGLSQSAVSRQVSALEAELKVPLFHRHARGLILTEQGELLYRTAHEVFLKLESARAQLSDSREKPNGELRVTTTMGLGTHWLTARVGEFVELFPDIRIQLILTDEELDLAMREADVAIRMRQPVQPDLVQRKLFTVHFHAYASVDYLKRHGQPRSLDELDKHRILLLGGPIPSYFQGLNWLEHAGREGASPRVPTFEVNSVLGLKRAVERGVGIGTLPDYLTDDATSLVQLFTDRETPKLEAYFTYAQEMRSVARIQVFRDFLISKAQRWNY